MQEQFDMAEPHVGPIAKNERTRPLLTNFGDA